jgi:hypothetical protein
MTYNRSVIKKKQLTVMIVFHEGWAVVAVFLPVDFLTTVFFVVEGFEDLALGAFAAGEEAVLDDIFVEWGELSWWFEAELGIGRTGWSLAFIVDSIRVCGGCVQFLCLLNAS